MKKYFSILSVAIVLGGMGTVILIHDHSPTLKQDLDKIAAVKVNAIDIIVPAYAKADHTSPEVIRPKTAMLVIDYGDELLPGNEAPVKPVAHGPPNAAFA